MSPTILQAAVHMWHPEAVDTFDNYLGTLSHFSDNDAAGKSGVWFTDITISHWRPYTRFENSQNSTEHSVEEKERQGREKEYEEWAKSNPAADELDPLKLPSAMIIEQFPPSTVNDERHGEKGDPLSTIDEECISLVMTGDSLGRDWTCTLVCDLMDEHMILEYAKEIKSILQMFIHQQYTGRALTFVFLLGLICKVLAVECEKYMDELDRIMGLEVRNHSEAPANT